MPKIRIRHPLRKSKKEAELLIRSHEYPFADRYGLKTWWEHRTFFAERAGILACISIEDTQISIKIDVPWMLRPFVPQIEDKVKRGLAHYFC